MKKPLTLFILLIGALSFSYGQTFHTLKGEVLQYKENFKLIGANIYFENVDDGTIADFDGKFKIKSDRPLPWKLKVTYIGFHDEEIVIDDPSKFRTVYLKEDLINPPKIIICPVPRPENTIKVNTL